MLLRLDAIAPSLLPARTRGATRLAAILGRDFADNALAIAAERDGVELDRPRRPADLQPRHRARPVSLRQRPAGARQAAGRRGARRLSGFPRARPPSDGGAVPRRARGRARRQRASGQGRGALPRRGAGARPDRRRAAPGACQRRAIAPRPRSPKRRSPRSGPALRGGALVHASRAVDARRATRRPRPRRSRRRSTRRRCRRRIVAPGARPRRGGAPEATHFPLGAACAQLHETYVVAQTDGRHRHRRSARGA